MPRALLVAAARVLNVTGPEILSVRRTAEAFGELFHRAPIFRGEEGGGVLLSNASLCHSLLGRPEVPLEDVTQWVARWIQQGGESLNKPTKFEVASGQF